MISTSWGLEGNESVVLVRSDYLCNHRLYYIFYVFVLITNHWEIRTQCECHEKAALGRFGPLPQKEEKLKLSLALSLPRS